MDSNFNFDSSNKLLNKFYLLFFIYNIKQKKIIKSTKIIKILLIFIISIIIFYSIFINNKKFYNFLNKKQKTNILDDISKKRIFFFDKKGEINFCTNFSILIYNYLYDKPKPYFGNIGDYIQSIAALQYLPQDCFPSFIDRDNIRFYNGHKSSIILNGWYNLGKGNRLISEKISPLYISYHISNKKNIDHSVINNLKKYQPIGCRDIHTKKVLQKFGINSYFSSCLTTSLDIYFGVKDSERTNEIIFIDYKFGDFPEADNFIKSLNSYDFSHIIYISHKFRLNISQFDRFKLAKNLLERYARAKLVISTRLHGALPCLGLKTPNIFINKNYDIRLPGLYELLNTIGINSRGKFEINVRLNNKNLVVNKPYYIKYSNKLKENIRKNLNKLLETY